MSSSKSPEPDGIQPLVYQKCWDIVGEDIFQMVREALQSGNIDTSLNQFRIVLIPKEKQPNRLSQFRPISLTNVSLKIITKTMTNRIRAFMNELIPQTQSSFIKGRQTIDNVLITQEILHDMRNRTSKKGFFVAKIDFEKAYDKINWTFLENVLCELGFPESWIKLIMACTTTAQLSLLWNGKTTEWFMPKRGLRQGDPLSPYLFVFCVQKLGALIDKAVREKTWKAVPTSRSGPRISHLMFADDLLLFGEATNHQVIVAMNTLGYYCDLSGQTINRQKSRIFFSRNVTIEDKQRIGRLTSLGQTENLGRYLGVPLNHGRLLRKDFEFILDNVKKKLQGWKRKHLALAGRATLIKSVTESIPAYHMQTLRLPVGLCDAIDRANRQFLWGGSETERKIHLINWDTVCKPKMVGGLGLRKTRLTNMAFLGKLGWQILTNESKLWVQVLRHKYLLRRRARSRNTTSQSWKSISDLLPLVRSGIKWTIGNGHNVKFWLDDWLTGGNIISQIDQHIDHETIARSVNSYWISGIGWDWLALNNLPNTIREKLHEIDMDTLNDQEDMPRWKHAIDGHYSVKSAYEALSGTPTSAPDSKKWSRVWKVKGAYRRRFFLWLLRHERVLTKSTLKTRHITHTDTCDICGRSTDTNLHALRDCVWARKVWEKTVHPDYHARFFSGTSKSWVDWNLSHAANRYDWCDNWSLAFTEILSFIWQVRNELNHGERKEAPTMGLDMIRSRIDGTVQSTLCDPDVTLLQLQTGWTKPLPGYYKMNVDAAVSQTADNDVHLTGIGGTLRSEHGNWISGFSGQITPCSSVEAEMRAILEGLELAWRTGVKKLILESDCRIAIRSIVDASTAHHYYEVIQQIRDVLNRDWEVSINCIWREANRAADMLAKLGMHTHLIFCNTPDERILHILEDDNIGRTWPRTLTISPGMSG